MTDTETSGVISARPSIDPPDITPDWWTIPGAAVVQHTLGVFDAGPADGWSVFDPRETYARPIAGSAMDGNADRAPNYWHAAHIVDRVRAYAPNASAVEGLRAARLLVAADRAQAEADREATEAVRRHADRWEDHPGGTPYVGPDAPDPFEGVRAEITSKRSNSGRTDKKVRRSHPAVVIGRETETAFDSHLVRGQYRPRLDAVARQPRRRLPRWVRCQNLRPRWVRTYAPAASLEGHVPIGEVWTDVRDRANGTRTVIDPNTEQVRSVPLFGRNALDVLHVTARAYAEDMISDVREWAEITPELREMDPRGVAIHRADMSGQSGVLALTDRIEDVETARWGDRFTLPIPRARKRDPWVVSTIGEQNGRPVRVRHAPDRPDQLMAPADHQGRARTMTRTCPFWSWTFTLRTPGAHSDAVWIGHNLVQRGARSEDTKRTRTQRGNRARRTIGRVTGENTPTTPAEFEELARMLAPGERVHGSGRGGHHWTLTLGATGRYSSTVTTPDRHTLKFRTRTTTGIARKIHAAVS